MVDVTKGTLIREMDAPSGGGVKLTFPGQITLKIPIISKTEQRELQFIFGAGTYPPLEDILALIKGLAEKLGNEEIPDLAGLGFRVVGLDEFVAAIEAQNKLSKSLEGKTIFPVSEETQ